MKTLWILLFPVLLFSQNYLQVGDYRVYPYSPTGLANWPTGYLSVTVDSANTQVAVDSVGNGETYQAFKSGVLERFMRNSFTFLDSFYVYENSAYSLKDPINIGFYDSSRRLIGTQGDMIRAYVEAYKATKETKYLNKAVRLWEQIQDSSYVSVYNRAGTDSVKCQNSFPLSYGVNHSTEVNIAMGMNDLYELIGIQEWRDYALKYYEVVVSWNDTVDAVGDTIRNFNCALWTHPDSTFRYNYGAYSYGFLMYATAKGWGNHSVSGDSLLYHMENYFRGGIDSTVQLRRTSPVAAGTWAYTGMEMCYDLDGQRYMKAAGYNEPYWDDWQYLVDGLLNPASSAFRGTGTLEGLPGAYLTAKDLGYTTTNQTKAAQATRGMLNQIYIPFWGYGNSEIGTDYDYGWRFPFWNYYYNLKYIKNLSEPIPAFPALRDTLYGYQTFDGVIARSSGYNMTYIAMLNFDLSAIDSFQYSVDNDSSLLIAKWFHGDTVCAISRLSCSYLMEATSNYPVGLIIGEPAPAGIYDATAIAVTDTADTTVHLANMPAGKDTIITYADSTVIFLFNYDEMLAVKSQATEYTYSIDNKTITTSPITKATINTANYSLQEYNDPANRNRFFHMQKRIIKWLYDRRLSRLAMGYAQ